VTVRQIPLVTAASARGWHGLAVCGHHPSGWSIAVLRRLPRRRTLRAEPPFRRVVGRMALEGRRIELHCRRCHRRPMVGRGSCTSWPSRHFSLAAIPDTSSDGSRESGGGHQVRSMRRRLWPIRAHAGALRPEWSRGAFGSMERYRARPSTPPCSPTPSPTRHLLGGAGVASNGTRTDPRLLHGGRGVQLHCRRCHHRPRKRWRALYELAERAVAAGSRDTYV
jgi:hypothetical protein